MPDIDDSVLTALSENLHDVTLRAARLDEWVELELYVLKLSTSFDGLYADMRRTFGSGPHVVMPSGDDNKWTRLASLWENCRDLALVDLELSIEQLQHVNHPLAEGGATATTVNLDDWLKELLDKGDAVQEALTDMSAPNLKTQVGAFNQSLRRRINRNRQQVKREISELVELTIQLRTRLETSLPTVPPD